MKYQRGRTPRGQHCWMQAVGWLALARFMKSDNDPMEAATCAKNARLWVKNARMADNPHLWTPDTPAFFESKRPLNEQEHEFVRHVMRDVHKVSN